VNDVDFSQFFLPEDEAKRLKEEEDRKILRDTVLEIRFGDLENYTLNIMESAETAICEYADLIIRRKFQQLIDKLDLEESPITKEDLVKAEGHLIDKISGDELDDEMADILYMELGKVQDIINRFNKK